MGESRTVVYASLFQDGTSARGVLEVRELETGALVRRLAVEWPTESDARRGRWCVRIALSPEGDRLVVQHLDGRVDVWDVSR